MTETKSWTDLPADDGVPETRAAITTPSSHVVLIQGDMRVVLTPKQLDQLRTWTREAR